MAGKNSANAQMDVLESKGKGMKLEEINICFAENGCTVSASYQRKAKKDGEPDNYDSRKWEFDSRKWVFESNADAAKKVESLLGEKSDNPGHNY